MAGDPYAALGVKKTASQEEIKKAYKRIARESHPDLNPDDAAAEGRFKAASAAYDLLKDPEKRARFDRGEIDASGQERPERRYYRDFAEAGAGRGAEAQFDLIVMLMDLFLARLARAGTRGVAPPEAAPGEAALIARLAPSPWAAREWASLAQSLGLRARRGRSVNLDPAALLMDMLLKIDEAAAALSRPS